MISRIEGAVAVIRKKGGLINQVDCYTYKSKLYIKIGGGYARVSEWFGTYWLTTNVDTTVLSFNGVEPVNYGIKDAK